MIDERSIQQRESDTLAAIKAKGPQWRLADVSAVDIEARTVELAFSSEAEVSRFYGLEILSHDKAAVRLERLNDGAALLENHNWDQQRGVVEKAWIDRDRKGRAIVRLSRSASGEELLQDIADRIKRHVSVAYRILGIKLTEAREDGVDVYTVTDWEPFEISIVSVPADHTVGIGRQADLAPADAMPTRAEDTPAPVKEPARVKPNPKEHRTMEHDDESVEVNAQAAERRGIDAERARIRAITAMAEKVGGNIDAADALMRSAINEGKTPDEFSRMLLDALNERASKPLGDQAAAGDIGMSNREVRQYSLIRVIRALRDPTDKRAQKAAAMEFEASEAAREKQEKKTENFVIPPDVLRRSVYGEPTSGERVMTTSTAGNVAGATGGYAIATTLMTASFIDLLRNRATIMRLARTLGGLVGNIDIPKQTAGATGYWIGEDEDASETGIELGQISMTPRTVAAYAEITRKLLIQDSLDCEALVRSDLAIAMALTIDKAGYYGGGNANQPLGIANYAGINAVPFVGVQPTYPEVVQMETAISTDNADVESMSFVGNAAFRGHCKTTLKFENVAGTIWEPGNQVNGYPVQITNQVNQGDLFHGNFGDLIVGTWGGLELNVDPYSNSKSGRLRIITFQDVDFALRRVESFCLGRKAP